MAADSACLLGCRMMLFQWGIESLILLLIGMAGSRMDTAEHAFPPRWAPTAPTAELEMLQEEERHLWEVMWVVRLGVCWNPAREPFLFTGDPYPKAMGAAGAGVGGGS